MNYSNEIKVGIAIVLTALILFFGIRFLAGLPAFDSGYELIAIFDDTEGLASGNPVAVSGVQVGSVQSVELLPSARAAEVKLAIAEDKKLLQG